MLSRVLGDDNASDEQSFIAERLDQTEYIDIVSDTEVIADFIFLNISGVDAIRAWTCSDRRWNYCFGNRSFI